MQPKISVIVAVYKAEAYLHKCVNSLLAQTFKDFEILLIDDGSPDDSGKICDEYAFKDNRVRVFHKVNEGVSATRQFGIDHACGEYSIHADPDDWVEPTMLEDLYNTAIAEGADLVICDYFVETARGTKYKKCEPTSYEHHQVLKDLFQQLHGSCCNKLIKLTCYKKYNVSFPKGLNHGEDAITWILLLQHPLRINYLPRAYYHYNRMNSMSLTNSYSLRIYQERKKYVYMLKQLLDYTDFENIIIQRQISLVHYAICGRLFSSNEFKREFAELDAIIQKKCHFTISIWLSINGFYNLVVSYYCLKQKMLYILHSVYSWRSKLL